MTWDNLISRSIWTLYQPSNFIIYMLIGSMLIYMFSNQHSKWKSIASKVNITFLIILLIIGITNLSAWIMWPLEKKYSIPIDENSFSGIIVLGGSEEGEISTYHDQVNLDGGGERLYQAAKLAIQFPNLPIIHSGGVRKNKNQWSENDVAKKLFQDLNIDLERIRFDTKSYNTYTNAIESKKLIKLDENKPWLLVTSAYHMTRSVSIFHKAGIEVVPYPTDFKTTLLYDSFFNLEAADNLKILDLAIHEYIGIIAYYVTGRS